MAEGHSDKVGMPAKPRVVVGLDFGTTFSGFAFAHVSNPERIYTFYEYPNSGGEMPYCKTLTACYYKPVAAAESSDGATWKLESWGYPARTAYERDIKYRRLQQYRIPSDAPPTSQAPSLGVFLSRFKLHLASRSTEASSATPLPPGLKIAQVITDYLRELGGLILKHLQSKFGVHFSNEMIQWCITVPSIWDNSAKATMKTCMLATGLVRICQLVTIVLEPEAASFHCQSVMGEVVGVVLEAGDKLVVADIGGGISDIVVQEVVEPGCRVKEVTVSLGGLCGGTYVDARFMEFLKGRVGEACLSECILKHPNVYGQLMKEWEHTKSVFDLYEDITFMNLPSKLGAEWERCAVESGHPESGGYDELEISSSEMQSIFDPVVEQNVELIQRQMVNAGDKVRVLAMVGGFSESPYLLRRMKEAFGAMADVVICPPNPGSAICQGAVALALNPNWGQLEQVVENVEQLERKNVKEQSEQEIAKEQQEQVEENVEQFERKIVKQQLEQEIGKEEQEQKIVEDQRAQEILKEQQDQVEIDKEQQDQVEIDKEQLEQKIVEGQQEQKIVGDERGQEIAKDHHEQGIVEEQQEHEENVKHQMEQEIAREQQEQGEIVKVQESEQIIVEHQREQELARDQHGMEIATAQHEQGFVKEQQDHGKNVKDQMEQEIIKEQQEQAEIVKEQQSEQEMQLEQLGKGLVMNRRGCVEEEVGRRLWPGSKHFYNFLVIFNILLEPLSNTVASLVNQGRVSLGLLAIWLRIRAGTSDQFCHKGRVKSKDLILGRFLGQGCSGIFYETSWSGSHDRLARKLFPGVPSDVFASEVAPLVALSDHPNILKTFCWTVDNRSCSLVMEYVGDNLSNVVQKRKKALNLIGTSSAPFKMLEAMDIVLQIASGLLHLHKNDIVHGDLKPNNILIDKAEMLVKLGDFGLVETKRRTTLVSQRTRSSQMVEWSAPELMEDNTDDDTNASSISSDKDQLKMTDSYSFASICVYVLGGKTRNANEQVSIPSACPEALASLISMCWSAEPILRPDFSVICDKLEEIVNELKQQSGDRLVPSRNC